MTDTEFDPYELLGLSASAGATEADVQKVGQLPPAPDVK